tara:strand:- start:39 stop:521 length:483 start_codon:yes stop_codon:yes gene_type:complete
MPHPKKRERVSFMSMMDDMLTIDNPIADRAPVFGGEHTLNVDAKNAIEDAVNTWLKEVGGTVESTGFLNTVTSGFRTMDEQQELYDAWTSWKDTGVGKKPPEATEPSKSLHPKGTAIDLGQSDFRGWFRKHGEEFGWYGKKYSGTKHHFEYKGKKGSGGK